MPLALLAAAAPAQDASFNGLGGLSDTAPTGSPAYIGEPTDVSADGSVVVGSASTGVPPDPSCAGPLVPFRWESTEGMARLGDLAGYIDGVSDAVSGDGRVVYGHAFKNDCSGFASGTEVYPVRWTRPGGPELLPVLRPDALWGGEVYDVNADGSVAVGISAGEGGRNQAVRWTGGGVQSISGRPDLYSWATGVSADGNTVVGFDQEYTAEGILVHPFLWRGGEGAQRLAGVSAADRFRPQAVSADGSTIVGMSEGPNGVDVAIWTEDGGFENVGRIGRSSDALSVSGDGTIAVGDFSGASIPELGRGIGALVWTREAGLQDLQTVFVQEYGLDLAGWTLTHATAISDDGTTIVGYGRNPRGDLEPWRAVLGRRDRAAVAFWNRRPGEPNGVLVREGALRPLPWEGQVVALVGADGTETTEVVVESGAFEAELAPGDITFEFVEASLDAALTGTFGEVRHDRARGTASVMYTHPQLVGQDSLYRTLTLRVAVAGTPLGTYPVRVYRAPVFMVHGLDGYPSLWNEMRDSLAASGMWSLRYLHAMDYSASNTSRFADNKLFFGWEIGGFIERTVREHGLSFSQVDVVVHSMGGVLTRLHVQDPGYAARPNVNRLITHNTPHAGSQAGDMVGLLPVVEEALRRLGKYDGAIQDLAISSEATLLDLNGPALNRNTVPSHAVVTQWATPNVPLGNPIRITNLRGEAYSEILHLLFQISFPFLSCDYETAADLVRALYDGEDNDLIVPVSSQGGGLPPPAATFLPGTPPRGQVHMGSVEQPQAIARTIDLLNLDPEVSNRFTLGGFSPPTLSYTLCEGSDDLGKGDPGEGEVAVSITSPSPGAVVSPGEEVTVSVNGSGGVERTTFVAGAPDVPVRWDTAEGSSGAYAFDVPEDAVGRLAIVALGSGPGGGAIDSVFLSVAVPEGLDSLDMGAALYVGVDGQRGAPLRGSFSDGVERRLLGVEGVTYEVGDPAIATVGPDGRVAGVAEGRTQLRAFFRGKEAVTEVLVLPAAQPVAGEPAPTAASDADGVRLRGVHPNPLTSRARVVFDLEREARVSVRVFDLLGRVVLEAGGRRLVPGDGHTVPIDASALSAGVYVYQLSAEEAGASARAAGRFVVVK